MIQTRLYEYMVSYTPQTQWIEKSGIKLWLAFFFIELGAGMFFVASLLDYAPAMLVGLVLCAIVGGGLHLLYLGKPLRFWRMMLSSGWKTSWISRGLFFVVFFIAFGLIHFISIEQGDRFTPLLAAADLFAFLTVIYGGFAMNYVNGIPLWNTALLPILYVVSGFWGGAEATLGIIIGSGKAAAGGVMEEWIRLLLIGYILLIPVYLLSVSYTSATGQISVKYMMLTRWSPLFWIAVVVVGMAVPSMAVVNTLLGGPAHVSLILYFAMFSGLIGDLAMRYLILRCGLYSPLIPSSSTV